MIGDIVVVMTIGDDGNRRYRGCGGWRLRLRRRRRLAAGGAAGGATTGAFIYTYTHGYYLVLLRRGMRLGVGYWFFAPHTYAAHYARRTHHATLRTRDARCRVRDAHARTRTRMPAPAFLRWNVVERTLFR
jgi:hypothetical protein